MGEPAPGGLGQDRKPCWRNGSATAMGELGLTLGVATSKASRLALRQRVTRPPSEQLETLPKPDNPETTLNRSSYSQKLTKFHQPPAFLRFQLVLGPLVLGPRLTPHTSHPVASPAPRPPPPPAPRPRDRSAPFFLLASGSWAACGRPLAGGASDVYSLDNLCTYKCM